MTKRSSWRAAKILSVSATALAAALALSAPAHADAVGAVRGHVDGATAGQNITFVDATTGQRTSVAVNGDGNYYLAGLRPGSYHVEVNGSAQADVVLPVGETVTLDLSTGEVVRVTGIRRAEVRTAVVGTNVSQFQMENLPQNDRNFLNFAALAPGVVVNPNPGQRQFRAGALTSDNVNVFIDGESYKNQTGHGGVAGQAFSSGNPFPQSAVQEFRVDTQNFGAQYEQAASAIINAVTRTGGEELHGGAFMQYVPKAWLGQPHFQRDSLRPDFERRQYGFDLGGALTEDIRLFVAYEGTAQTNPSTAVNFLTPTGVTPTSAYTSLQAENNGSFPADFQQDLWFAKATWFASDQDTIDITAYLRREDDQRDFGGTEAASHGRQIGSDFDEYLARWQHRSDDWLNSLSLAYQKTATGTPRLSNDPETVITNVPNGGQLAAFGGHFFEQNNGQEIWTLRDNVNWEVGDHVINAGAKVAWNKFFRFEHWFTNGTYRFAADASSPFAYTGSTSDVPWAAQISRAPEGQSQADNTQIGLYFQDDWTIDEHWTANLGLRWDYESNMFNNKYVTPTAIATALRNYVGWQAAGIDPEDYISDGNDRKAFKGAFQPRLALSYDVNGDRSLVFFGGAGRYYDRNVFLQAAIEEQINDFRTDIAVSFNGSLPCNLTWNSSLRDPEALRTAVNAACSGIGGSVWLLNDKTDVPYTDAFDVGVRGQWGDLQYSATLVHNITKNIFMYVRGNRLPDGTFTPGGDGWVVDNFPTSGPFAGGILPGFSGKLNIGQNQGESEYNALYLVLNKPFTEDSRYGYTAALTLQDATTNIGTELGADEFFAGSRVDVFGTQNVQGVDKWRFVASGIVELPWEVMLSGTVTLASGPAYGFVDFSQTPPMPGACCVANLGGKQFPSDSIGYQNVDLRVARTFKVWGDHEVTPELGIFNVFDSVNRNYSAWGGRENSTTGNARTYQVGLRYEF